MIAAHFQLGGIIGGTAIERKKANSPESLRGCLALRMRDPY